MNPEEIAAYDLIPEKAVAELDAYFRKLWEGDKVDQMISIAIGGLIAYFHNGEALRKVVKTFIGSMNQSRLDLIRLQKALQAFEPKEKVHG